MYQVGSPAMFDGNRFFPETGTPIWKIARSSTVFELCEPEPFAVATWMEKSFTTAPPCGRTAGGGATQLSGDPIVLASILTAPAREIRGAPDACRGCAERRSARVGRARGGARQRRDRYRPSS